MPRRVPELSDDVTVYLVLNDYRTGLAYVETAAEEADRETVIRNFLSGQYSNALRVVANTAEGWSQDVSEDIVTEGLRRRRHPLRGHEAVHRPACVARREAAAGAVGSAGHQRRPRIASRWSKDRPVRKRPRSERSETRGQLGTRGEFIASGRQPHRWKTVPPLGAAGAAVARRWSARIGDEPARPLAA
jgi:hypothetical protein